MDQNPTCFLYYITSGSWQRAPDLEGRLEAGRLALENTNLFERVSVKPVDASLLKATYRELERRVVKNVEFSKTAVFPKVNDVDEAYIGLLSGDQFIDLVSRDDGELNRELFYDNVRDFQGENPVNKEIHQTLSSAHHRNSFPLLNNGITIVARSITRTGDNFRISDFQIVNGCQTTHMLYFNRNNVDSKLFIPIKLVATGNSQVVADVIKATNRQTAVLPEALESLTPFHKELEDFYSYHNFPGEKIYYERRSKQYALDNIRSGNIVSLTAQTKSFVGMFLNEPHSHPRYYGELLKAYERRLFVQDHKPESYYASGVSLVVVERLLNTGTIDRSFRQYKYHILMLLRIQIAGRNMPRLNSKEISQYSLSIVECLHDPVRLRKECEKAVVKIRKCLENLKDSGDPPHRLRVFTNLLLQVNGDRRNTRGQAIKESRRSGVSVEKMEGTIKWYDEWKRFGAIDEQNGDIVTFDEREIQEIPLRLRKPGTKVRYQTEEGRFGQVACNVVLKITVKSPHLGGSKRRPDYHSS